MQPSNRKMNKRLSSVSMKTHYGESNEIRMIRIRNWWHLLQGLYNDARL